MRVFNKTATERGSRWLHDVAGTSSSVISMPRFFSNSHIICDLEGCGHELSNL